MRIRWFQCGYHGAWSLSVKKGPECGGVLNASIGGMGAPGPWCPTGHREVEGDLSCLDRKGWRDRRLWTVTAACAFTEMPAGDFTPHSRALGVLSGLGGGLEGFLLCEDFDSCGRGSFGGVGFTPSSQPSESASTPNPGASEGPQRHIRELALHLSLGRTENWVCSPEQPGLPGSLPSHRNPS